MDFNNINKIKLQDIPEDVFNQHIVFYTELRNNPLLEDIENQPEISDVEKLIALEEKRGMSVKVVKFTGEILIDVRATVNDLKISIKDKINRSNIFLHRENRTSWFYIWKKYSLMTDDKKILSDDKLMLSTYNIKDGDSVNFILKPIPKRIKRPRVQKMNKRKGGLNYKKPVENEM